MKIISLTILGGLMIGCSGGGGKEVADGDIQENPNKDVSFYAKELNKLTSIKALHTEKTILFTMNSLEKTLNDALEDVNSSSISEIIYQLHRSLEGKVQNIDRFTFNNKTAFIIKKPSEVEKQMQKTRLAKTISKDNELDLNYELDKASRKIIGKSISTTLPNNFSELLNSNKDVDEDNNTQTYISFAPNLPKEIACPPLGTCRKNSPMDKWKKGGLAEVQKLRQEYRREITDVLNDNNATTRAPIGGANVRSSRSWSCPSYGYTIQAVNYVNGTSAIDFMPSTYWNSKVRSITSYQPFDINERFDILRSPNDNSQASICLTDGTWIPSDEQYYYITKYNDYAWANTSSHWEGATNLELASIENAAQALSEFRFKLSANANGPLPSSCGDIECSSSGSSMPDGSEEPIDPLGEITMVEMSFLHPELSGQDLFNLYRGDAWGTHKEDISGLTSNWIRVMDNLGIINGSAIKQNIIDRWNSGINDGTGTFIFKKLEMTHIYTMDFVPEDESLDHLLILPKQSNIRTGSFPTNMIIDDVPPRVIMPFSRPNPYYCAQIDPFSNSYIPVLMVDSEVLLELTKEVEYLTENQLDRIEEEKNIKIWEQYFDLNISQSYGYASLSTLSYPARIEYNCRESERTRDENTIPILECDTKDEAYYDALIDRLIVLNPTLNEDKNNHPCLGALNPWLPSSSF